ncbi:MAG: hypothetical protein MJE66_06110, partial [Proteobacteria bacterium]|nr:hypothetical protein [Pseudomonadota bacterium]
MGAAASSPPLAGARPSRAEGVARTAAGALFAPALLDAGRAALTPSVEAALRTSGLWAFLFLTASLLWRPLWARLAGAEGRAAQWAPRVFGWSALALALAHAAAFLFWEDGWAARPAGWGFLGRPHWVLGGLALGALAACVFAA